VGAIPVSSRQLRRPTLIMLGLGEAGQKILYQTMKLAKDLNILDVAVKPEREELKIEPIRLLHTDINKESAEEAETPRSGQEAHPSQLYDLIYDLKRSEIHIRDTDVDKMFLRPGKEYTRSSNILAEALAELMDKFSPIISARYGFSMIRIDLDEETLRNIGEAFHKENLPVPPGISIISKETKIEDPILSETVSLQPTGGSGGRSSTVYRLLRTTESSIILDLLGIPTNIKSEKISRLKSALPSYRAFMLIHGLVGTGAGVAEAILDSLKEQVQKDILSARFKMSFTVIPSAEEAHIGKLDSSTWIKVFKWDTEKLLEFMEDNMLDTTFIVDLDFAILQYNKNQVVVKEGFESIKNVNNFIRKVLDGELKLYRRNELKKYTGLTPSTLFTKYDEVDSLIAYALEPILCIHGPRDVRFGAGGSSVDEMEFKDMTKSFVAIPMVSTVDVFRAYLNIAKRNIEKSEYNIDEESLAALLLPALHGMLAPMTREIVEKVIVIISEESLEMLQREIGYIPTISDLIAVFKEIFSRASVKVLVSSKSVATSVVAYALVDPEEYLNNVAITKGWV